MFIRHRRLLDQITLLHGPHDLLGRFFLIADTAAKDQGVRLRLRSDFDALVALNEQNRDSWPALAPVFNPQFSNLRLDGAFWLEAVNNNDETVATHAARFFDWEHTTLAAELRSMRVFYEDPAPRIAAGESIEVEAPTAALIRGRVAYGGAVWVRPDFRGKGLAALLPRISRVYAYSRWDTTCTWGLVEHKTHAKGLVRANGPYEVEESVLVHMAWRGDLPLLLMWMGRDAMLSDVAGIVDHATVDNSRRMERPSTNRSLPPRSHGMSNRS
jgi:GNAT superfamily N-acetyltransferase